MDTKNLVIFGVGVIAGYLLVDYLRKNPMGSTTTNPIPVPPIATNEATCQASLDAKLQTLKMMPGDLEAYKKEFMDNCLKVEGTPCSIVVGGVVGIMPGVYKNGVCVNPNSTQQGTGGYIDMGGGGGVIGGGVGNPTGEYDNEYYNSSNEFEVICNDGTKDVSNGIIAPCTYNGGVKMS